MLSWAYIVNPFNDSAHWLIHMLVLGPHLVLSK
jgi:hypothetical protein